jgi:hypothetical protein
MQRGLVHRLAWVEFHGQIETGHEVHHICRNKLCVNAEHLASMTREAHAALEGRPIKLTEAKVVGILDRLAAGDKRGDVAKAFGISPGYVSAIKHANAWGVVVRRYWMRKGVWPSTRPALLPLAIAA